MLADPSDGTGCDSFRPCLLERCLSERRRDGASSRSVILLDENRRVGAGRTSVVFRRVAGCRDREAESDGSMSSSPSYGCPTSLQLSELVEPE